VLFIIISDTLSFPIMVGLQYYEVASLNTFRAPEHWEWRRQYGLCESILLVHKIMATEWNRCARVYSIRAYDIHYTLCITLSLRVVERKASESISADRARWSVVDGHRPRLALRRLTQLTLPPLPDSCAVAHPWRTYMRAYIQTYRFM